jgi:hypothetical protein
VALTGVVPAFAVPSVRAAVEAVAQPDRAASIANPVMAAEQATGAGRHRTPLSWLLTTEEGTRRRPS